MPSRWRDERGSVRTPRRCRGAGEARGGFRRRHRRGRRSRDREGGGRGDRRHRGDAAVRPWHRRRTRAADHQAHRDRVAAQQDPVHPARGTAAQSVRAMAAHPHPDARCHLPLLRGCREGTGQAPRTPRARHTRGRLGRRCRALHGHRCHPYRLHPLGRDHGDRPQRSGRPAVRAAATDPSRGRRGHHRRGVRRRRGHREDGRHRPEPHPEIIRSREEAGPRPGRRDAETVVCAVAHRHRGDAVGGWTHPAPRDRHTGLAYAVRPRSPRRRAGARRRRSRRGAGLAGEHGGLGGDRPRRRRRRRRRSCRCCRSAARTRTRPPRRTDRPVIADMARTACRIPPSALRAEVAVLRE